MNMTGEPKDPRRVRDRVWELVDRHGDDYLDEGKKLLRRARRTMMIVGVVVAVTAIAIVAIIAYAILR